jgi:hypothetical protein
MNQPPFIKEEAGYDAMKNILGLLFLALLSTSNSWAQSKLLLKPHIGGQVMYGHSDRSIGKTAGFRAGKFDITDNYGLLLQLELNDNWSFTTGWSKGNIGWGNRIRMPKEIAGNPYEGPELNHRSSNYIHRFPINCYRTIKDFAFLPINRNQDLYLFNFRLHGTFGFSLDHIDQKSRFDNTDEKWTYPYGDLITYQENNTIINRWSGSVMVGFGMQFFHLGKDRFDLNIIYNQGLRNMIQSDITYTLNTQTFFTRMFARGSYLGATLAYPIRLKTFGDSNTNR